MSKFKVGDLITGIDDSKYNITTNDAIMEVLKVNEGGIEVKVIKHTLNRGVNRIHYVNPEHFKLVKFQETELVTKESSYTLKLSGYKKTITEEEARQLRDELNSLLGE